MDNQFVDFTKYEPAKFKARKTRKQEEFSEETGTRCHFSDGLSVSGGWTQLYSHPTIDSRDHGSHIPALSSEQVGSVFSIAVATDPRDHRVRPTISRYHVGNGKAISIRNQDANLRFNFVISPSSVSTRNRCHSIKHLC